MSNHTHVFRIPHAKNIKNLSDSHLYSLCRQYGERTRFWRQKFIGLLPEVNERKLYEKKGFDSIFMFAKILAGLSEEQVRIALNLEKRFSDKPALHELFVNGEVSVNKLVRVVSVATAENQETLADQIKLLSKSSVEVLARDMRNEQKCDMANTLFEGRSGSHADTCHAHIFKNQNGLLEPLNEDKSLPGQTSWNDGGMDEFGMMRGLGLSEEVVKKLRELKAKNVDINQELLAFLNQRKVELENKKEELTKKQLEKGEATRHVPTEVKKVIKEEYGDT